MPKNPYIPNKPSSSGKFTPVRHSAGILDDFAVRKNVATKSGTIEKVPVNSNDIVNKAYVSSATSAYLPLAGGAMSGPLSLSLDPSRTLYNHPVSSGIIWYGSPSELPAGWLLCDGTAVSRTTYADLFAAIGVTYGSGDGSTTFNLPDTMGRFLLGQARSGTGVNVGDTGGNIDHTHSVDIAATTSGGNSTRTLAGNTVGANTQVAADGHTHSTNPAATTSTTANPPFLSINFLIKT